MYKPTLPLKWNIKNGSRSLLGGSVTANEVFQAVLSGGAGGAGSARGRSPGVAVIYEAWHVRGAVGRGCSMV